MALTDLLSQDIVNDVNTTSNVTSAGLAIASLKVSQDQLRLAELGYTLNKETLKEMNYGNKYAQQLGERQIRLLGEILNLLQSIDNQLRSKEDGKMG